MDFTLIKKGVPYILLVGLLVLTLCTKNNSEIEQADAQKIEIIDSVATGLESAIETVHQDAEDTEKAIDELLEDI